jgi:arsenical pump membrane protein
VFATASAITAVLSLDATVVLLTPVVYSTSAQLGARPRPHVYACTHLANSASLLLPVSNLLAFAASGLAFPRFAALMALPWLAAIATEYLVLTRFVAADLDAGAQAVPGARPAGAPVFVLAVVAATLAGFVAASAAGVSPAWAAFAGAAVLAVRALAQRRTTVTAIGRSAAVPFLLFVLGLGIVVQAVVTNGLGRFSARSSPAARRCPRCSPPPRSAPRSPTSSTTCPRCWCCCRWPRRPGRHRAGRAGRGEHRAQPDPHRLAGHPALAPRPA